MILRLADGKEADNKDLIQYAPVILELGNHKEPLALDISNLIHDIILGLPWFEKHNPTIDWGSRTISFDSSYCINNCNSGQIITMNFNPVEHNCIPNESSSKV
jgi:hypothetical protein